MRFDDIGLSCLFLLLRQASVIQRGWGSTGAQKFYGRACAPVNTEGTHHSEACSHGRSAFTDSKPPGSRSDPRWQWVIRAARLLLSCFHLLVTAAIIRRRGQVHH